MALESAFAINLIISYYVFMIQDMVNFNVSMDALLTLFCKVSVTQVT